MILVAYGNELQRREVARELISQVLSTAGRIGRQNHPGWTGRHRGSRKCCLARQRRRSLLLLMFLHLLSINPPADREVSLALNFLT